MKYSIDRVENEIAIIENIETGEKKEISVSLLPEGYKEGSIIIENNEYTLDLEEEKNRRENIRNRFDSLIKK